MPEYALVDRNDAVLRTQVFEEAPADVEGKGWRWLPLTFSDGPTGYAVAAEDVTFTSPAEAPTPDIIALSSDEDWSKS